VPVVGDRPNLPFEVVVEPADETAGSFDGSPHARFGGAALVFQVSVQFAVGEVRRDQSQQLATPQHCFAGIPSSIAPGSAGRKGAAGQTCC